jgi:nucleoside-diphosphate-sugar epimerase
VERAYYLDVSRYLVTGAAGFIGARVCELLLDAGHEVVGVDDLNSAYDPRLKHWRLRRLQAATAFRFSHLSIADSAALESLFEREAAADRNGGAPFAAVLNLAARAGVRQSIAEPAIYFATNVGGTLNLLNACRTHGVKKFILASTSSVYGTDSPRPFAEDSNTKRLLSPYAESKHEAEVVALKYHQLHSIDVTILRYFTVYGPMGRPDMSIFRFMRQIAEGEPVTLFGDGSQERDFTYVDDIARGTIAALKPLGREVINLGSDRPVCLDFIIRRISDLFGREPVILCRPAHPADVPATWARIERARDLLGWTPRVDIEQGLGRTADWYRENRDEILTIELRE